MSMLTNNYNTAKIFVGDNCFDTAQYTNSGENPVTLPKGALIGRITASGKVLQCVAAASDGSVDPLGVLAESYTVAAGATADVTYCFGGKVVKSAIVLTGGETLDTIVTGKGRFGDLLVRNTHIIPVGGTELTGYDNQ